MLSLPHQTKALQVSEVRAGGPGRCWEDHFLMEAVKLAERKPTNTLAPWPWHLQQPDPQPSVAAGGAQVSSWLLQGKGWHMFLSAPSAEGRVWPTIGLEQLIIETIWQGWGVECLPNRPSWAPAGRPEGHLRWHHGRDSTKTNTIFENPGSKSGKMGSWPNTSAWLILQRVRPSWKEGLRSQG